MDARHGIAEIGAQARAAADALRRNVVGEVSTSALRRWLYSTDASSYRVVPSVVLVAGSTDDLIVAATVAAEYDVSLSVRGAGTSLAGQAIGPGIIVDCFKLARIVALDPDSATARVEPGVIQASLNRAAAAYGLEFGPDTSTVEQATIGGMIGNNSSGSRSVIYGESRDKVRRIAAVLVGGEAFVFGPTHGRGWLHGIAGGESGSSRAAAIADALEGAAARHRAAVADAFPNVQRCTSGYNVRELLESEPNLARLLAGSEGTLALFTELEVTLDPRPAARMGAALTFADIGAALRANVPLLETGPSAVELLDLEPLRDAGNLQSYASMAPLVAGDGRAMLLVEYQGEVEEARDGLSRLRTLLPELRAHDVRWLESDATREEAASLRRAVLPLLMGAPGVERPVAFIEDTAVAPDYLDRFVSDFQRLVEARGLRASFSGHASAGCIHVRPLLDLRSAAGLEHYRALSAEVAALVAEYRGVISGEHGCGRSRSCLLPGVLGSEVYAAMVEIKDAFDPKRLLAPGVIIDGRPVDDSLRFTPHMDSQVLQPSQLTYAGEGGFSAAVERCFGAGLCKKITGSMCPSAAVGRDEMFSTRARANALQGLVSGALPMELLDDDEFDQILGTCVACKACATECPAGVDMATLKIEWLAVKRQRGGFPLLARAVARYGDLAPLGAYAAPLVRAVEGTAVDRLVRRRLGIAASRRYPRLVRNRTAGRRLSLSTSGEPSVVLFADCFTKHQEPEISEAFRKLLDAAGVRFEVLDCGCCGRTAFSMGDLGRARKQAQQALEELAPVASRGGDVLFVEPSCLAMVRDDWRRLLPDDVRVSLVAQAARPALGLIADLADGDRISFASGGRALLHAHCHERSLSLAGYTERALRCVPALDLEILDAGCCGMSGIFGYEAEHYELSVAMAERALAPAVRAEARDTSILATGTSCRVQIADLTDRRAQHPIVFLAERCCRGESAEGSRYPLPHREEG